MATGTIIWFDPTRGFGFIRPSLGPCDVYLPARALDPGLEPRRGAAVEFDLCQTGAGRVIARRVRPGKGA